MLKDVNDVSCTRHVFIFIFNLFLSSFRNCSIILVLDLSEPNKLWYTAETLLKAAQDRVEAVIRKASAQNPKIYEEIKSRAWKRIGEQHPVSRGCSSPKYMELHFSKSIGLVEFSGG